MKPENFADHMGRVHPKVPKAQYAGLAAPSAPRAHRRRRVPTWVPYAAVLVAVVVGAGLFFALDTGPKPSFYANHEYYDFGYSSQTSVSHSFTFENLGAGELTVWGLTSSCDCTSGYVVIDGVQSPMMGMHTSDPWVGRVAPGDVATLVAMHDVTSMPDHRQGTTQELYLQTNDPAHSTVTFTIHVKGP